VSGESWDGIEAFADLSHHVQFARRLKTRGDASFGGEGGGGENNTWAASYFMISAVGHSGVSVVVVLYKL
jgi:hypothetical protein